MTVPLDAHSRGDTDLPDEPGRSGAVPATDPPASRRALAVTGVVVAGALATGNSMMLVVIAALLSLVLLHEAGHFLAARATGMAVHDFSVGFGPTLWSRRRGEVLYSIKALPLGGFVRIVGMSSLEDVDPALESRTYRAASYPRRLAVIAAGPAANFAVAAVLLFVVIAGVGLPAATTTLADVQAGRPAAVAGVTAGDRVLEVEGTPVGSWAELTDAVAAADSPVSLTVERDGQVRTFDVVSPSGGQGPRLGVAPATVTTRLAPHTAALGATQATGVLMVQSLDGIREFATGFGGFLSSAPSGEVEESSRPLSPVGAVRLGDQASDQGAGVALGVLAIFSVFIGVFNLLPIPPLDGGHIAVATYEAAASRRARRRVELDPALVSQLALAVVALFACVSVVALVLDIVNPAANPF